MHPLDARTQPLSEWPRQSHVLWAWFFTVRGEPIVCNYRDAYLCFMRTNMDYLVLENFILDKKKMKKLDNDKDWKKEFVLD